MTTVVKSVITTTELQYYSNQGKAQLKVLSGVSILFTDFVQLCSRPIRLTLLITILTFCKLFCVFCQDFHSLSNYPKNQLFGQGRVPINQNSQSSLLLLICNLVLRYFILLDNIFFIIYIIFAGLRWVRSPIRCGDRFRWRSSVGRAG